MSEQKQAIEPVMELRSTLGTAAVPCSGLLAMEPIWAVDQQRFYGRMEPFKSLQFQDVVERQGEPMARRVGRISRTAGSVAVIGIDGVINKRFSWPGFMVKTGEVAAAVQQAVEDEEIKVIILRIDSPGGAVDGLAELGKVIREADKSTRIIAQVDGTAASAAYYLASQARDIRAKESDWVGSIGTLMVVYDLHALFEREGIKTRVITTGKFKATGVMGTELDEEMEQYLQGLVNHAFADFIAVVKSGRRMSESKVMESADGRVFNTPDALQRGLIDEIAALDETLAELVGGAKENTGRGQRAASKETELMAENEKTTAVAAPEQKANTPGPATIGEIKAALPKSDAEFRCECLEQDRTLQQCKDTWTAKVEEQNAQQAKELNKLKTEQAKASETAKTPTRGVEPVGSGGGTEEYAGDAIAEFNAAVQKNVDRGMKRERAVSKVVHENPALHAAYLTATGNEERAARCG
jgi:signal peptide peptidase SppA